MVNVACPPAGMLYEAFPTTLNSGHGTVTVPEIGLLLVIVKLRSRVWPSGVAGNASVSGAAVPAVYLMVAEQGATGQLEVPVASRLRMQLRSPACCVPLGMSKNTSG